MPCESLDGFREIGTHLRAHDGCHVLTFFESGRDVTTMVQMTTLVKTHLESGVTSSQTLSPEANFGEERGNDEGL